MDSIEKFLLKLSPKEREWILFCIQQIISNQLSELDVKKMSGEKDLFRVRKGKIRIIFRKTPEKNIIINIDYRGQIYK